MDGGVSVNLTGRRLKDFAVETCGEAQHVDRPMYRRLSGLNRIVLVIFGRRRTGQIVDFIDFDTQGKRYIMPQKFEPWVIAQVLDIGLGTAE